MQADSRALKTRMGRQAGASGRAAATGAIGLAALLVAAGAATGAPLGPADERSEEPAATRAVAEGARVPAPGPAAEMKEAARPAAAPGEPGAAVKSLGAGGTESLPLGKPAAGAAGAVEDVGGAGAAAAEATWYGGVGSMAAPLAVVVGVILLAAALVRKCAKVAGTSLATSLGPGGSAPSGLLEVIGRYPVARGQMLVLLKVDRRVLLLSHTARTKGDAGGFATLAEFGDPEEVASMLLKAGEASGRSMNRRFQDLLADLPDDGVQEVGGGAAVARGRRTAHGAGGDRAELWDERAAAVEGAGGVDGDRTATPGGGGAAFAALRARLTRLHAAGDAA